MSSKQVDFFVKIRDAFTMAAEATNDYVESLAPAGVREEKAAWNPEKIVWNEAEGTHGKYERSEDANSLDFKNLMKDLSEHEGKLSRNGFFYWSFSNGVTVGRKNRSPQSDS